MDGPPLELKYDGPSQIGWAPGFVKSKTDGENAAVWSQIRCDPKKKKKVFTKISTVFPSNMSTCRDPANDIVYPCDFDGPFITQCNLDGSPLELMGPLNTMGPEVIDPLCPLSRRPCLQAAPKYLTLFY